MCDGEVQWGSKSVVLLLGSQDNKEKLTKDMYNDIIYSLVWRQQNRVTRLRASIGAYASRAACDLCITTKE